MHAAFPHHCARACIFFTWRMSSERTVRIIVFVCNSAHGAGYLEIRSFQSSFVSIPKRNHGIWTHPEISTSIGRSPPLHWNHSTPPSTCPISSRFFSIVKRRTMSGQRQSARLSVTCSQPILIFARLGTTGLYGSSIGLPSSSSGTILASSLSVWHPICATSLPFRLPALIVTTSPGGT